MKKLISLSFLMLMIILVHADLSRATSGKVNSSFAACGRDCIIGADDWDAEFPVNSHIGRMLFDVTKSTTGKTGNPNRPAVDCPQTQGYRSCLPSPNGGNPEKCGEYNRAC